MEFYYYYYIGTSDFSSSLSSSRGILEIYPSDFISDCSDYTSSCSSSGCSGSGCYGSCCTSCCCIP